MQGIAIPYSDIPLELIERHHLDQKSCSRLPKGLDEKELRFTLREKPLLLPVWQQQQLQLLEWGNLQCTSQRLPKTAWCKQEDLTLGVWANLQPMTVEIPSMLGLEGGVWYELKGGVQGIAVYDEQRKLHVYLLTKPATHYYRIMTRANRMPMMLGEEI